MNSSKNSNSSKDAAAKGQQAATQKPSGKTVQSSQAKPSNQGKTTPKKPQEKTPKVTKVDIPTPHFDGRPLPIRKILVKDFQFYAADFSFSPSQRRELEEQYCERNTFQYKVMLQLYLHMMKDFEVRPEVIRGIVRYISERGLIAWIKVTSDTWTSYVIRGDIPPEDTVIYPLILEFLTREETQEFGARKLAELLRFGNRFSPAGLEFILPKDLLGFIEREKENQAKDRQELSRTVKEWVIAVTTELLSGLQLEYEDNFEPTPGAVYDSCTSRGCKEISFVAQQAFPGYEDNPPIFLPTKTGSKVKETKDEILAQLKKEQNLRYTQYPYLKPGTTKEVLESLATKFAEDNSCLDLYKKSRPRNAGISKRTVIPISVPKSWKGGRIVCPDHLIEQSHQLHKIEALRKLVKEKGMEDVLPIFDQSVQRESARKGSLSGDLYTFDLTAASDLVRKKLVRDIYPQEVANWLLSDLPELVFIPKQEGWKSDYIDVLYMAAPMGSAETFDLEKITFYSILEGACRYQDLLEAHADGFDTVPEQEHFVSVFGDDCVVHAHYSQICIEWLTECGLIVNNKSCVTTTPLGNFREACGGDYLNGLDISVYYWPRQIIEPNAFKPQYRQKRDTFTGEASDSLSTLIALSKRIRTVSKSCAEYLNDTILRLCPEMTSSAVGEPCGDLWWEYDFHQHKLDPVPCGMFVDRIERVIPSFAYKDNYLLPLYQHQIDALPTWKLYMFQQKAPLWVKWASGVVQFVSKTPFSKVKRIEHIGGEEFDLTYTNGSSEIKVRCWVRTRRVLMSKQQVLDATKGKTLYSDISMEGRKDLRERALSSDVTRDPRDRKHYLPMVRWNEGKTNPKKCLCCQLQQQGIIDRKSASEWLVYQTYLREGPQYEDSLMRLLKVSTQRRTSEVFGDAWVTWALR